VIWLGNCSSSDDTEDALLPATVNVTLTNAVIMTDEMNFLFT
jgi:hypothetical protein